MNYFKFVFIISLIYWGMYMVATIARIFAIEDRVSILNNLVIH